jgi:ribosomal protein L16/L10AE
MGSGKGDPKHYRLRGSARVAMLFEIDGVDAAVAQGEHLRQAGMKLPVKTVDHRALGNSGINLHIRHLYDKNKHNEDQDQIRS